jgi:hypothetical protein
MRHAVALYLATPKVQGDLYEAAYREMPEDPAEIDAYVRAAAEVLGEEDWS